MITKDYNIVRTLKIVCIVNVIYLVVYTRVAVGMCLLKECCI